MGYACPVCGAEQADGVHLANHLAITASLGRTDHENWLETRAPDWADCGQEELADRIVDYAPTVETPEFEGSGPTAHDHGRPPNLETELAAQSRGPGRGELTEEASNVLSEARELTRRMQESVGDDGPAAEGDESAGGDEGSATEDEGSATEDADEDATDLNDEVTAAGEATAADESTDAADADENA